MQPRCCDGRLWKTLDVLHDVWTVASSLTDIVTDVLVAYEFYTKKHFTFFYGSVLIFIAAQLSYAFLFTGTWAAKHNTVGKCGVFLLVLPFGQLIPIFAWVESFRFPAVDHTLKWMKLQPTGVSTNVANGQYNGDAVDAATNYLAEEPVIAEDSLWAYIQKKYTAHAGFLAEAFVEAIPQGVLQTVAILVLDDTSGINIFSILMSISVVARSSRKI